MTPVTLHVFRMMLVIARVIVHAIVPATVIVLAIVRVTAPAFQVDSDRVFLPQQLPV
jgi:hypothetical protein